MSNQENYVIKNNFDKTKDIESKLMVGSESNYEIDFSFFIPTFNRIETLVETINSVFNLKELESIEYEIIISDNSANFTEENKSYQYFKALNNPKIKYYINTKNIGLFNNWNRGIILSKGKYFVMIHDDDLLHENYLIEMKKCLNVANREGDLGFIHTKKSVFYSSKNLPEIEFKGRGGLTRYRLSDSVIDGVGPTCAPTCGTLFEKKALLDIGGYDDFLYPSSDQIIGSLLIEKGLNGYMTEDSLGYYRVGLNESIKPNTIKKIIETDYYISNNYIYQMNFLARIFGMVFSNIQYSFRIDVWVWLAHNKYNVKVNINDLDFRKTYKTYKASKFLLNAMCFIKNISKRVIHE